MEKSLETTLRRIVDLRDSGLSWWQVEGLVYPEGVALRKIVNKCLTYELCTKHKKNGGAGAFKKSVSGCFTPTQVVTRLKPMIVPMQVA